MEVSGRPGPAEFHSAPWSKSHDSYNLTWKVDSYPPLQEVRLLYRKLMVMTTITIFERDFFMHDFFSSPFLQMNETFQQPSRWHDGKLSFWWALINFTDPKATKFCPLCTNIDFVYLVEVTLHHHSWCPLYVLYHGNSFCLMIEIIHEKVCLLKKYFPELSRKF